jgi:putative transposase
VVAALRDAVTLQPARGPFCGVPDDFQYDNALAHLSNQLLEGCALLAIGHGPIAPYSAYLNGKLERFHRTLRDEFSAGLPFFTHAPQGASGEPLHPPGEPIHIGLMAELLIDYVVQYNCHRPHRSLGGRTPEQAWLGDPTPIREPDERTVRLLALPSVRRTVVTRGIGFRRGHYVAPELNAVVGDEVDVRHAPHDDGWVEVFHDDRWLCTALRSSRMSRAQAGAVARRRKQDSRRADAAMERRLMRDQLNLAELKELERLRPASAATAPSDDRANGSKPDASPGPSPLAENPPPDGRSRPATAASVLEAYGLISDLNQAREESKEEKDA